MSGFVLESEEELAAGGPGDGTFKLLPEDEYVALVESLEIVHGQTSMYNTTPHDEWKVRFDLQSFTDGTPVIYDDDSTPDPARPVRLTTYFDPSKKGMIPQPSKTRKFITSALGVAIGDRVELDDPQQLVGKRILIRTIHKLDGKNVLRDRISDYSRLRRTRGAAAAPVAEAAPVETAKAKPSKTDDEVTSAAEAKLAADVFGDDLRF